MKKEGKGTKKVFKSTHDVVAFACWRLLSIRCFEALLLSTHTTMRATAAARRSVHFNRRRHR